MFFLEIEKTDGGKTNDGEKKRRMRKEKEDGGKKDGEK